MSNIMVEKLAINVNGAEKIATGLTKTTTIDDIKYAMLTTSKSSCELDMDDFGVFERWQGNERLLDGRVKIYKLIRLWQSLPGDQLSQVEFLIKRKKSVTLAQQHQQRQKLSVRSKNHTETTQQPASFALCTLSPSMQKTWNYEKMARKSSYVNRQLKLVAANEVDEKSTCSTDNEDDSSSDREDQIGASRRRYASIKRYHRSKKSTIKKCNQMRSAYVDLVGKQGEIIDRQLEELSREQVPETDMDEQIKQIVGDYLTVENCLEEKLVRIEQLTGELNSLMKQKQVEESSSVAKTARRLQASIEVDRKQVEKIRSMDCALERIDDIITLKQKSVETLESELKRLEELSLSVDDEVVHQLPRITKSTSTSSATSSSHSSTSSLFTSISSISSQSSLHNHNAIQQQNSTINKSYSGNDNESDTGISSANSEDFSTQQLETLV
jgi:hypothetical protein